MSLQEILSMATVEKLNVIEQIWDSINKDEIEIPESQKKELDRRISLYKNDKTLWLSLNEMKVKFGHNP